VFFVATAAVLACSAFAVYARALHGPFVFDDFSLPFYKPSFPTATLKAWIAGVRPLLMFSYWVNFKLSERDTYSYHVLNLLLHLANSAAVFLIVRCILARKLTEQSCLNILSAFAAALFLLHPIQTESVAYVAGRSEVLSAFFFLYAFAIFLYQPVQGIGWRQFASILVLFACALTSKEHTATLPILFLITDLFWSSERPIAVLRRNAWLYLTLLLGGVLAVRFIWIEVTASTSAGFDGAGVSWISYALTECSVFFVYLQLFFFPAGQNFDYDMPWSPERFEIGTFVALLGIAALVAAAWRLRKRFSAGSYGFFVFLLLLAPTSSFIPIKDAIAEHRLYLPMLGLVLVACEIIILLSPERTWIVAITISLIVAVSSATYDRNGVWASESALWEDTVSKSPNKLRGYGHLVHGLVQEHRCRDALRRLADLSRRVTIDAALLSHWSFAYECVNEPEHALEKLQQSVVQKPLPTTYINMARHQIRLNRAQDAIQSLTRSIELDPAIESAYLMRAGIFERLGDSSSAARDYSRARHPIMGHLDAPVDGALTSGTVLVGGWVISKASPVAEVSIYMDDQPLMRGTIGIARPDVARAYATEAGAANSGWHAVVDTTNTPAGQHLLLARAKLQDGAFVDVGSAKIVVAK